MFKRINGCNEKLFTTKILVFSSNDVQLLKSGLAEKSQRDSLIQYIYIVQHCRKTLLVLIFVTKNWKATLIITI